MARPATDAPRRLGPYRLHGTLGHGALGPVHLGRGAARRGGRKRLAAVRALRPELLRDRQLKARLRRDLDTVRTRVTSPYAALPLGCELDGERPWAAVEFVPGPSLARLLVRYGPPPEAAVRALGAALAHALADLHAAGVAHRTLRPASVLVAADRPRAVDCALGALAGEPPADGHGGPADDVFDLDVLLALTASGRHPFRDGPPPAGAPRTSETPGAPGRGEPAPAGVPAGLRPVLLACLDREPGRRPAADALAASLDPAGRAWGPAGAWLPELWLRAIGAHAALARELGGRRRFGR